MNFNLTTDPWIPVRWLDGHSSAVSLHQLFAEASQIADLAVPPHERISLLRLLICITQAAHGAPATSYDWDGWDIGLEASVTKYLTEWNEHFELMGEGKRFLQEPITAKEADAPPTAKIVFHLSTGNTVTLLDHEGNDSQPRVFQPAVIARNLLTYQNHFDCDFMGQSLAFKGTPVAGTAIHALHSFLIASNLRETIILNCIDTDTLLPSVLGDPIWKGGKPSDYLHRLVPAPCKIWLLDEGRRIQIHKGFQYQKFSNTNVRETSTTVIVSKIKGVETPMLLKAKLSASLWRDLHCIAVIQRTDASAPLTLLSHFDSLDDNDVGLWSGELVKTKGKVLDTVESFFTIPFELFKPAGQIRYQKGVNFAVTNSLNLNDAVKKYFANFMQTSAPTETAKRHFWNTLDQQSSILLALLKKLGTPEDPMGSTDFGHGTDPWTLAVRAAAKAAFEATCPRQTPRQYQAYAAGLTVLLYPSKKAVSTTRKKTPATYKS